MCFRLLAPWLLEQMIEYNAISFWFEPPRRMLHATLAGSVKYVDLRGTFSF